MTKQKVYQLFKQNSELEVLISAAIVFTAFVINDVAGDWIIDALNKNISGSSPALAVFAITGLYMSSILPISIVSHFILRIYWLALVGLKSVFPEQNRFEVNPVFDKVINSSLDLDKRIQVVDRICSSIFAFTFLTLFAFCFSFISMAALIFSLSYIADSYGIVENLINLILLFAFVYMIDFLTLGWLKKRKTKTFARIYNPIYRFFGWITLAFLYRGIYYSLIQNASRRVMLWITPIYMIVALVILNIGYDSNSIFPALNQTILNGEVASSTFYKDQFAEKAILRGPFLESFTIPESTGHIRVYFSLNQYIEDNILNVCDSVQAYNSRGIHWRQWLTLGFNQPQYDSAFHYQENARRILDCFSEKINLSINDSTVYSSKYYFSTIDRPRHAVFFTTLDIKELERGDHILKIDGEEMYQERIFNIPFWRD
ncbi:MAG: hypothetical protein RIM99_11135 [Cyclobacteriaceae bacterium]